MRNTLLRASKIEQTTYLLRGYVVGVSVAEFALTVRPKFSNLSELRARDSDL